MERSRDNSDHSSRAAVIRDGLGRQVIGQSGMDGKRDWWKIEGSWPHYSLPYASTQTADGEF